MLKIKSVTKEVDGTTTAELSLTADQAAFLLSYAVSSLVEQGLAEVTEGIADMETEGGLQ